MPKAKTELNNWHNLCDTDYLLYKHSDVGPGTVIDTQLAGSIVYGTVFVLPRKFDRPWVLLGRSLLDVQRLLSRSLLDLLDQSRSLRHAAWQVRGSLC